MMAKHDPAFSLARWAPSSASPEALTDAVEAPAAQDMAETAPEELKARRMRAGSLPEQNQGAAVPNQRGQRRQKQLAARIIEAVKGGETVKTKPVAMALGVTSSRICDAMARLCALGAAERGDWRTNDGTVFKLISSTFVHKWVQA